MRILVGKSKEDILHEFYEKLCVGKHDGGDYYFKSLVEYLEKPKIHLTMRWKHWILIWTIPLLIIGLSAGISIIWEMTSGGFPWLTEFENFSGKFVNIMQAVIMISGCLFMIIFPFNRWNYHYDWNW